MYRCTHTVQDLIMLYLLHTVNKLLLHGCVFNEQCKNRVALICQFNNTIIVVLFQYTCIYVIYNNNVVMFRTMLLNVPC